MLRGLALLAGVLALASAPASAQPAAPAPPVASAQPVAAAPARTTAPAARPRKVIIEPPAPVPDAAAVAQAEESNLEAEGPRVGWVFGASVGPWQQLGSVDNASRTAGLVLRVGKVATPKTVILLEAMGLVFPQGTGDSYVASSQALSVIALTYVAPTVWVRGGTGFAFLGRAIRDQSKVDTFYDLHVTSGLGALIGAGIDVVHWRRNRLALESTVALQRFGAGWLADLGVNVSFTAY